MKQLSLSTFILFLLITMPAFADGFGRIVESNNGDFWGDVAPDPDSIYSPDNKPLCIQDGMNFQHYKNGKIYIEAACQDGQLHGFYKEYRESGLLFMERNFSRGQFDGVIKTYHPNGQLALSQYFTEGIEDGKKRISYSDTGKVIPKYEDDQENYVQVGDYMMVHKDFLKGKKRGLWSQTKTPVIPKVETNEEEGGKDLKPQYEPYYMEDSK